MSDISRHTGKNLGGLNRIYWLFAEDAASVDYYDSSLYCQVTLRPGRVWNRLYGTPETIQLESEQQDTPAGPKYSYKLKVLVPKDRIQVESQLMTMATRRLILKVEDKNGTVRIFGTIDCPMKLSSKLAKPAALETFNGYELLFSGEFSSPAGFLLASQGIPDPDPVD